LAAPKPIFDVLKMSFLAKKGTLKTQKTSKTIKYTKNTILDHYALIFIFSLKFSLLKLFHRPSAAPRRPAFIKCTFFSHGTLGETWTHT
jgi:hypothetical protein